MTAFRATAAGVEAQLSEVDAAVLGQLPDLLATVGEPGDDPAGARLSPVAHRDDPAAAAEFSRLAGPQLEAGRRADRRRLAEGLRAGTVTLSPDDAEAWLRVIGEARLLLAARAGIHEDGWSYEDIAEDPRAPLLFYLSQVQDALIAALMGEASLLEGL